MYLSGVSRMDWHVRQGLKEKEQRQRPPMVWGPRWKEVGGGRSWLAHGSLHLLPKGVKISLPTSSSDINYPTPAS